MPRSKPKAQRLAPPNSTSRSERDSQANTANDSEYHVNSYQPASQRQQQMNHSESLPVNQPHSNPPLVSPRSKTRECLPDTSATEVLPKSHHGQPKVSPKTSKNRGLGKPSANFPSGTVVDVNPLCASNSRPSTDTIEFSQEGIAALSPRVDRLSSPQSCATSDTASVALEDCVPELEEFDDIVLPAIDTRRNRNSRKPVKRPSLGRDSKARVLNSSAVQSSTSRAKISGGSRAVKAVVVDPTADTASSAVPVPALEVCNPVRAEKVDKRRKSSFIFVSDDEVKSVFDRQRASTDGSGVGVSQGNVERHRFGEYWKELETVSIRRSAHTKAGERNSGQKRLGRDSDKAPSLDPQNKGSLSKMTENPGKSRTGQHGKSNRGRKQSTLEVDKHPITEEDIDGGDGIPVDANWKRKPVKRGRNAFESVNGAGMGLRLQNGLDDGEDTGGSTGFSESDGQACMQCGGHGKASKMVLCDVCSDGCHTFCMRPARVSVPLGVWICPRCHSVAKKHKVHLSKLGAFMESNERVRG